MNIKDVIRSDKVDFTGIDSSYFLLGLLSCGLPEFFKPNHLCEEKKP